MSGFGFERFVEQGTGLKRECAWCERDHLTSECPVVIDSPDPRRVILGKLPLVVTSVRVRGPARVVAGARAWLVDGGDVAEFIQGVAGWTASREAWEATEDMLRIAAERRLGR